jgi:hypothetical protein
MFRQISLMVFLLSHCFRVSGGDGFDSMTPAPAFPLYFCFVLVACLAVDQTLWLLSSRLCKELYSGLSIFIREAAAHASGSITGLHTAQQDHVP